jgi:hypothetical protein
MVCCSASVMSLNKLGLHVHKEKISKRDAILYSPAPCGVEDNFKIFTDFASINIFSGPPLDIGLMGLKVSLYEKDSKVYSAT